MRTLCVILLVVLFSPVARAGSVRVYIVPTTTSIPVSGEVAFEVYWYNDSDRPAKIPAFERFSFMFGALAPLADARLEARSVDHAGPDRSIAPWATVHDQTTITIHAKPDELVAISATFYGNKSRFKSNTVVLRNAPKA
ncbi:MAG TPA: hypothetical protein VM940_16485 [Chthoniobacterales bacterium]|nr:hypothetical protein [Chthoniobacterales bacterium]